MEKWKNGENGEKRNNEKTILPLILGVYNTHASWWLLSNGANGQNQQNCILKQHFNVTVGTTVNFKGWRGEGPWYK